MANVNTQDRSKEFILWFSDVNNDDVGLVGGKTASLGEMYQNLTSKNVSVPNGFAVTAYCYKYFVEKVGIAQKIRETLEGVDAYNTQDLQRRGAEVRKIILQATLPKELKDAIRDAYAKFCEMEKMELVDVAVRSSATAEDLPESSFAGQLESFLNVRGEKELIKTVQRCMASLFTDRAIAYREHKGFDHFQVLVSIAVQRMVRSDKSSSGVMFTLDTESGFRDVVLVTGAWGLGENVVQGAVNPDEFVVHKPTLLQGYKPLLERRLGSKEFTMMYGFGSHPTRNVRTEKTLRDKFCISDEEVLKLARWAIIIENHYSQRRGQASPMDIEWAKDGLTDELFIVQARPETVHSQRDHAKLKTYRLTSSLPFKKSTPSAPVPQAASTAVFDTPETVPSLAEKTTLAADNQAAEKKAKEIQVLAGGVSVGMAITTGRVKVMKKLSEMHTFEKGSVLVSEMTDPDWEPIIKKASAVITNRGGRTCHAAIISRELGIPCIVGCRDATETIPDGTLVTVDCTAGKVYAGEVPFEVKLHDLEKLNIDQLPVKVCLNVGNPYLAFEQSFLPNQGVGLARMEFIVSNFIQAHPLALLNPESVACEEERDQINKLLKGYKDGSEYFVARLARGIGLIAAAFYPKRVILRFSDFKTSEYRQLIGGTQFEPVEDNPMIGWRGCCRYYDPSYRPGFNLECLAVKKVREEFGLVNLDVMVPFCRTVAEAKKVVQVMEDNGLVRDPKDKEEDRLRIMCMCEIPSNVILADQFLDIFDGFSIGSNDLTQLVLGVDRNGEQVAHIFDERDEAVKQLIGQVIDICNKKGKYSGICGQAPSDYPEFAKFVIDRGITAISLTGDALLPTVNKFLEK